MSYKDKYDALNNAYGSGIGDTFKQSSISKLNDSFKDSPFYEQVTINGILTDVRVVQGNEYNKYSLLFKPGTTVYIGSYANVYNQNWIVEDFFINDIYPKSTITLCNDNLKWKDKSGNVHSYPCAISKSRGTIGATRDSQFDIQLPDGNLYMSVQMNDDTKAIPPSLRLTLNSIPYTIEGIDNISQTLNGKGILIFTLKPVLLTNGDDPENGIADNSIVYGGSAAGSTPPSGGDLW